eukprot:5586546-Prymnesium_polylepis.1
MTGARAAGTRLGRSKRVPSARPPLRVACSPAGAVRRTAGETSTWRQRRGRRRSRARRCWCGARTTIWQHPLPNVAAQPNVAAAVSP